MKNFVNNEVKTVICRLPQVEKEWGIFVNPIEILSLKFSELKKDFSCVKLLFHKIEFALQQGHYVAGYLHYEAAIAFDRAFSIVEENIDESIPVVAFGIFDKPPQKYQFKKSNAGNIEIVNNLILTSKNDYIDAINKLKEYIYSGDIYQANYTVRTQFEARNWSLFEIFNYLNCSHPVPYSAYVSLHDGYEIASISPELFFQKQGVKIISLPMKGTMARHYDYNVDRNYPMLLKNDEKNCAENVMICDMVRNDIGRIAKANSVNVEKLFHVDTYQTLHQMISEVSGNIDNLTNNLYDIFQALFPAASITGAPKVRAMEVIKELESSPRGVYTGTIGCIYPNGDALFNVPIRTLEKKNNSNVLNLSVGSGVVADSDAESEWKELINKSEFVTKSLPLDFKVFSTMLYNNSLVNPIRFFDEHLQRLENSQKFFGRKFCRNKIINELEKCVLGANKLWRLKIILDEQGDVNIIQWPINKDNLRFNKLRDFNLRLKISKEQINSKNVLIYHKSTSRAIYDDEFGIAIEQGYDEVIFTNENDFVTEGAISNIFIRRSGKWFTPHRDCGLLNGIMRAKLIQKLHAEETFLTVKDLRQADQIIICNALRGIGKNCEIDF